MRVRRVSATGFYSICSQEPLKTGVGAHLTQERLDHPRPRLTVAEGFLFDEAPDLVRAIARDNDPDQGSVPSKRGASSSPFA